MQLRLVYHVTDQVRSAALDVNRHFREGRGEAGIQYTAHDDFVPGGTTAAGWAPLHHRSHLLVARAASLRIVVVPRATVGTAPIPSIDGGWERTTPRGDPPWVGRAAALREGEQGRARGDARVSGRTAARRCGQAIRPKDRARVRA